MFEYTPIEIIDNTKFQIGRIYYYTFACDSDTRAYIIVLDISKTRKTATVAEWRGNDEIGKPFRKKISTYAGVETISAGNYSMAGIWHADEYIDDLRDSLGIDFMLKHEKIDRLAETLNSFEDVPPENDESTTYLAIVAICDKEFDKLATFNNVDICRFDRFIKAHTDEINGLLGAGEWRIDYTLSESGNYVDDGVTLTECPAALLETLENHLDDDTFSDLIMSDVAYSAFDGNGDGESSESCGNCGDGIDRSKMIQMRAIKPTAETVKEKLSPKSAETAAAEIADFILERMARAVIIKMIPPQEEESEYLPF